MSRASTAVRSWGERKPVWAGMLRVRANKNDSQAKMDEMKVTDLPDYNRADLSALTDLDAFLSEAKQLARVKVDEEGVEAAAVTMMMCGTGMPPEDPEICVMDLDRPFLFIIRTQDVPLFVGVVNQIA